jgi:hypothetical protein
VFQVQSLDRILIVHDNGTKTPRRILRLRSLARSGKSVYVMADQSQIAQAMSLLELHKNQRILISEMPDVQVTRTSNGGGTPKKLIESDVVWAIATRNDASAGVLKWHRRNEYLGGLRYGSLSFATDAVKEAGHAKPVLFLTEREAEMSLKNGKIDEGMRLDKVLDRAISEDNPAKALYAQAVQAGINRCTHQPFVRTEMLKRAGISVTRDVDYIDLLRKLRPEMMDKIDSKANETVSRLAAQFPLLFGYDRKAAEDYIAMCESTGQTV